jgi:hypothetical protein
MTRIERQQIIKQLVRASDAANEAFRLAAHAGEMDLAKTLRTTVKSIGDSIHSISEAGAERPAQGGAPS